MPDIYTHEIFSAVRMLIGTGIVWFAYKTTRDAASGMGRWPALWRGTLCCMALAALGAATLGAPSCERDDDPLHGGCEQYADDGYTPSTEQRSAKFLFFVVLLLVPVGLGASHAKVRIRGESNPAV